MKLNHVEKFFKGMYVKKYVIIMVMKVNVALCFHMKLLINLILIRELIQAAKAAMFYITDYKMDIKTHEMLSLMSKAIAQNPGQHETTDQGNAKALLHKILSQFSHQQQIHGQQAVCYL